MKTKRQILTSKAHATTIRGAFWQRLGGIAAALLFCAASVGAAAEQTSFDIVMGYHLLLPKKYMDWRIADGAEIQARLWQSEHIGLALSAASDTWSAKPETSVEQSADSYVSSSVSGDASVTTLGASILYRSEPSAEVKLILDLGLRYALVDSSVYGEASYSGTGGSNYLYEKIGIENSLLFVIGAGLEFEVTKNISFTIGAGYQVDLKKPKETFAGESLGETSLDAVSFNLLLACRL